MKSIHENLTKTQLYKIFFLALRGFYCLSALVTLGLALNDWNFLAMLFSGIALGILGVQFWASLQAERMIEEKNHNGVLLGLLLCLFALPGYSMPIALLGIYALLNKDFRDTHLPAALPQWMAEALLKLDSVLSKA